MSKNIAVIFAGGSGARMGAGLPKQFLEVNGMPIIIHTLENFEEHSQIDEIYIACKEEYIRKLKRMLNKYWIKKVKKIVPGGTSGQDSIFNALCAAAENNDEDTIVLIHDGVRPCITAGLIDDVIACVSANGSAITCTPMLETPVLSNGGAYVGEVLNRQDVYTAQAPQAFHLGDILKAHKIVRETNPDYEGIIDSCTLMKSLGREVSIVPGPRGNIKVTTPEDLYIFRAMIQYQETRDAFGLSNKEIADKLRKQ